MGEREVLLGVEGSGSCEGLGERASEVHNGDAVGAPEARSQVSSKSAMAVDHDPPSGHGEQQERVQGFLQPLNGTDEIPNVPLLLPRAVISVTELEGFRGHFEGF